MGKQENKKKPLTMQEAFDLEFKDFKLNIHRSVPLVDLDKVYKKIMESSSSGDLSRLIQEYARMLHPFIIENPRTGISRGADIQLAMGLTIKDSEQYDDADHMLYILDRIDYICSMEGEMLPLSSDEPYVNYMSRYITPEVNDIEEDLYIVERIFDQSKVRGLMKTFHEWLMGYYSFSSADTIQELRYDKEKAILSIDNKELQIDSRASKKRDALTRLFYPEENYMEDSEPHTIEKIIDSGKNPTQALRDMQDSLSKQCAEYFGVKDLFQYEDSMLKINPRYIKKIK